MGRRGLESALVSDQSPMPALALARAGHPAPAGLAGRRGWPAVSSTKWPAAPLRPLSAAEAAQIATPQSVPLR